MHARTSEKQKVGYLGPTTDSGPDTTTFGYMAALKHFAAEEGEVELVNLPSHPDICKEVGQKKIQFGVVGVENVIAGMVAESIRAIEETHGHYGVSIWGEIVIPIQMFYLSKNPDIKPTKVLSHSTGLEQCSKFINALIQNDVESVVIKSTGEAAYAASQDETVACIASARAEEVYGLQRIGDSGNVADNPKNMTRFWILNKEYGDPSGHDKSCFLVNLEQTQVGAFQDTLGCFADHGCNLLIAYPISIPGKPWEYTFLLEYEGHIDDEAIDQAWEELRNRGLCLNPPTFLGSYPSVTSNIHVPA